MLEIAMKRYQIIDASRIPDMDMAEYLRLLKIWIQASLPHATFDCERITLSEKEMIR